MYKIPNIEARGKLVDLKAYEALDLGNAIVVCISTQNYLIFDKKQNQSPHEIRVGKMPVNISDPNRVNYDYPRVAPGQIITIITE